METKSQMINRIAELAKENVELKAYKDVNEDFKTAWEELKAENKILLGQLVINDGEDVTVQISKSQFDEYNKYRTTLQEIKAIVSKIIDSYIRPYGDYNQLKKILDLITKAEEE